MPDKNRPTKRMRESMRGKCQKSNSYDAVDLEYDFLEHMVKKTEIPLPHLIEVIQGLRDFAADEEDGSFKIACILKLSLNVKWAVSKARTNENPFPLQVDEGDLEMGKRARKDY